MDTNKGFEFPLIRTEIPGPESRILSKKLKEVESPNITYISGDFPVFIKKTYMMNVWDVDDNRYIDMTSMFGVSAVGHTNSLILDILKNAEIINGMGDVLPTASKVKLLGKLRKIMGGGYKGILGQNGADAVEAAMKTALLYTGRHRIIAFKGGYHGLSYGALNLTWSKKFKLPFKKQMPVITKFFEYPRDDIEGDFVLEKIDAYLSRLSPEKRPGLIFVELIQARGGVRVAPYRFIQGLKEIADRYDILLGFDEIYTGLGRTGKMFAFEHYGVKPDIITLGKALSSSFPVSVCLATDKIMEAWPESQGEAIHTSTFLGHPLICEVAATVLDQIKKDKLYERAERIGRLLMGELKELELEFPGVIKEVRGKGLLIGIEFRTKGMGFESMKYLLKKGFITLPAGENAEVLEITPPLVITEDIAMFFIQQLRRVIEDELT